MQVLLLGAGTVTSRLNMQLAEQGHSVIAQIAAFTPQHIDLFDFRALIVVSPESSVSPESLVKAAERGKMIFVVAGVGDGMASWANGVGVPSIAYPPSDVDINKLYEEMRRADAGNLAADDQYRRAVRLPRRRVASARHAPHRPQGHPGWLPGRWMRRVPGACPDRRLHDPDDEPRSRQRRGSPGRRSIGLPGIPAL